LAGGIIKGASIKMVKHVFCAEVKKTLVACVHFEKKHNCSRAGMGNLFTIMGRINCGLSLEGRK